MIDQFINFIIRPPRAQYNPDQYLWEKEFILAGKKYLRKDLELKNARGFTLQCSHYLPFSVPEDISLPCVVYCHGNSGCRADANEAAVILLPSNITVFTLDFSGSGLSDGDHVSLGWHEKEDLKMVVSYLRENKQVSRIGLWGRSMGAVTCLLYGAEDPSIAGMVLDSAFSNLYGLMMELVDVYKIRLPKFTLKMVVQYMRRVIEKKAKFDIMDLNCLQAAPKTFIPVLFGHANDDDFVHPHHSDLISESYAGDKNTIRFEGDHNSTRPQIFYDSVCIFFYNVLRPPHIPKARRFETYYSMRDSRVGSAVDEDVLYDIVSNLRSSSLDDAASSSASTTILNSILSPESEIREETTHGCGEPVDSKVILDEPNSPFEDYFSYCGSTKESLGGDNDSEVFATPLGSMRETLEEQKEDEKNQKKKKKKKAETVGKKPKPDRLEKLESFSRRLRLCILRGSSHRRNKSS